MKRLVSPLAAAMFLLSAASCIKFQTETPSRETASTTLPELGKEEVAKILSSLPLAQEQIQEVHDAVNSSSGNGYDEEYTMERLFNSPGSGVGDPDSKAPRRTYGTPLRSLFREYFARNDPKLRSGEVCGTPGTKADSGAAAFSAEDYLEAMEQSGLQIYWPYADDWDGETFPLVTFDPGFGAESNYAYEIRKTDTGYEVLDSILVDEQVARTRPVWVINSNTDSEFTPGDLFVRKGEKPSVTKSGNRLLMMKSMTVLRNYDSWFAGASEMNFQIGTVEGFSASTEAELQLYYPTITSFTLVVKRKQIGESIPLDIVLMTDFTNQLEKLAFLITEDDGGTVTSWKCSATVKVQSKSYGFDVDLPYRDKDDIVWRGQLTADYLREENVVSGRFGDVEISFALE